MGHGKRPGVAGRGQGRRQADGRENNRPNYEKEWSIYKVCVFQVFRYSLVF